MDMPELTHWKTAMLMLVPFLWGGPKPRAWAAVFLSSVLAWIVPLSPPAYLAIDLFCGGLVLAKPAGVAQKAIGLVFTMMALIDLGYVVSPQADHGILYYGIMVQLGWVQFAILAAWGSYDAIGYIAHRFGLDRRAVAHRADTR